MANSEEMKAAITQMAIQVTTMAVKAIRETDPPAKPNTSRRIPDEHWRPMQARPIMSQLAFK